jgi:hypothetical protein
MPRQKKGRHEVPIQKALISHDCAGEERGSDGCDPDLGNQTGREMLGVLSLVHWRRHLDKLMRSTTEPNTP